MRTLHNQAVSPSNPELVGTDVQQTEDQMTSNRWSCPVLFAMASILNVLALNAGNQSRSG